MKISNTLKTMRENLRSTVNDERGAESSEYILILVLLVVGLIAMFGFLRKKLSDQGNKVGNCIGNASTATGSTTC